MAKDNKKTNAPVNEPIAGETPATPVEGSAPVKEKAKAGTSVQARAKRLLASLSISLPAALAEKFEGVNLTDLMSEADATEFLALSNDIKTGTSKGLPLTAQLAEAQKERNEIYARAKAVNGVMTWATDADESRVDSLGAKIKRLKTAIENAKKGTSTVETPETETGAPATA